MSRARSRKRSRRARRPPGKPPDKKANSKLKAIPIKLKAPRQGELLNAKYDSAQRTPENAKHWAMADSLSADEANSHDVRKTLRERARCEVANNSYAKGIVLTLANDCVGTGPRLQLLDENTTLCRRIEEFFISWANEIDLPGKLRSMRMAKATDGETFAILTSNPAVNSPVKLDIIAIEADRITSPMGCVLLDSNEVDGIHFDGFGNAVQYDVLKTHPGSFSNWGEYESIDADCMIHWFRSDRPGQHRGVPEITPAIELFAQLRRYTLAVIAAAETAADFAAVIYSDSPANGEAAELDALDLVQLEKRMATTLPDGWKLSQIKAEQPCTSYGEFKKEILNEIARCLNIPFNIAACNSSGYNYASGRLDHQTYFKSLRVEQSNMAALVLDKIFDAWIEEAFLVGIAPSKQIPHQWFFDGIEHVDPKKEADAQARRLESMTTTLAYEYARQGKDWETELRQLAKERKLMAELGLSVTTNKTPQPKEDDNDEEDE